MVTLGLTNILNENHTELNFFEGSFHEILVRETNLYAQQKAAVKPDQNESGTFFFDFRVVGNVGSPIKDELARTEIVN